MGPHGRTVVAGNVPLKQILGCLCVLFLSFVAAMRQALWSCYTLQTMRLCLKPGGRPWSPPPTDKTQDRDKVVSSPFQRVFLRRQSGGGDGKLTKVEPETACEKRKCFKQIKSKGAYLSKE